MKIGFLVLLLAALLVAMPVAAFAVTADNGAGALTMSGTKTSAQEEVGGLFTAENMAALAVVPNPALAVPIIITMALAGLVLLAAHYMRFRANLGSYKSTPGAGGEGLLAPFA
ncbi:MAG: hypothetical protein IMZ69_06935 [Spirochaetes bacterium]|nr:hypothetical protein [Spirochaetota bacterium]